MNGTNERAVVPWNRSEASELAPGFAPFFGFAG